MFIEPRPPSKLREPIYGRHINRSFGAGHEASTTCVSTWDQTSILSRVHDPPAYAGGTDLIARSFIKTQRRIALLNDSITLHLTHFLSRLFFLVVFDNQHTGLC